MSRLLRVHRSIALCLGLLACVTGGPSAVAFAQQPESSPPAAEENTPAAEENPPAAEENTPAAEENTPAAEENTPAAEENASSARRAEPSDGETEPPAPAESADSANDGNAGPDTDSSTDDSQSDESSNADSPGFDAAPDDELTAADLMGEFVGSIQGDNETTTLGIQIRPMGEGRFEALSYAGGLPGTEGCQLDQTTSYVGIRAGDTLILSGGPLAIFVDADTCTLVGRDGSRAGRLDRVTRTSPTLGAAPPDGAILITGGDADAPAYTGGAEVDDSDGDQPVVGRGVTIQPMAVDFDLHVEFKLPPMFNQTDQNRGNSGVYLQSRYECQVLDSFAQKPVFNGCGALYRFKPPEMNMTLPPGVWQTYDIRLTGARFAADGRKIRDARISSWLNGVAVQRDVAMPGPTGMGKKESPTMLATVLQDHGDPVVFRNVWMIDRGLTPGIEFPINGVSGNGVSGNGVSGNGVSGNGGSGTGTDEPSTTP